MIILNIVLLKVIDRKWMDHIDDMDQLRQGIGLQAYGQRDPLVEYKMAGFDMFDEMISAKSCSSWSKKEDFPVPYVPMME